MKFRDYQEKIIGQGSVILGKYGLLYLSMEVRTGKTLTSLGICEKIGAERVLFLTKKKAISSIEDDYKMMSPSFELQVINYESAHKINLGFCPDIVIADESHSLGAFPKPSSRAKRLKADLKTWKSKLILMSGTPTPESFSQMYHQVYGCVTNPFSEYKNFYRWSDDYVNKKQIHYGYKVATDYSHANNNKVIEVMSPYTISFTQKEAGFKSVIDEEILHVDMEERTYDLCKRLKKDKILQGSDEVVLGDTGVKLMQKLHQIYSGTVIFESKKSVVLDYSKAKYIKKKFKDNKIGIFYKFTAELKALKEIYGDDLTTDLEEFNTTNKNIALQIVSGREGISLRKAKYLVYYNIDFSATSYWQSRDRMTTKERMHNKVYWVFSKNGIESKIYQAVNNKKDYTLKHFKNDYAI
jgi:hypothetical protein|tara:strand:- start:9744 stop:10976 length:1233 start_codon:yes stop_codon:yes gene_type:complete